MIISDLLRFFVGCLSAWYPNNKVSTDKDTKLKKYILKKIKKIQINNKNLQKTHKEFNQKIIYLLQDKNLRNFLRKILFKKCFFYRIDFSFIKN